jgi:hypothetical protein
MNRELLQKSLKHIRNFSRFLGGHISEEMNQLMVDIEQELAKPEQEPVALNKNMTLGCPAYLQELAKPEQEPVAWRNAAIRLGEDLYSVGPNGYYEMTAKQWLDWALSVVNTAPSRKEWVGLSVNEGRDFFESKLTRAELITEISEFLEEKNNAV